MKIFSSFSRNIFLRISLFAFFSFLALFLSGCEISDKKEEPKIFIPTEYSSASINTDIQQKEKMQISSGNVISPEIPSSLKKEKTIDGVKYSLIQDKKSPKKTKIWKLFSANNSDCTDKKGLCILEVWEGERKVFFIEEGTPGDIIDMYKSLPDSWIDEDHLGFIRTQKREVSTRTLLYSLDLYDGIFTNVWKSVKWNPKNLDEKNTIMIIRHKGQSYFLDAISSSEKISLYKILDPNEEFYVTSGGLKNLKFLESISLSVSQEVKIETNPNEITFSMGKKKFFYTAKNGIVEKK